MAIKRYTIVKKQIINQPKVVSNNIGLTRNEVSKEILKLNNEYKTFSQELEEKQRIYLENYRIETIRTKERVRIPYNPIQKLLEDFEFLTYKTNIIQSEAVKKLLQGFFITLTLPTQYHEFKEDRKTKKLIRNPKYNPNLTIHDGYKYLLKMWRKIYNTVFKVKKISFDFVRVIEPHKDFTPHLHGILFVPPEYIEIFHEQIAVFFGNTKLEKHKTKTIYIKNTNIGRSEVETLLDTTKTNNYLMKYIEKNAKHNTDDDSYHLWNGWRKANKIRVFSTSYVDVIPRDIFNAVSKRAKKHIDYSILSNFNPLQAIDDITHARIEITNEKGEIEIKQYGNGLLEHLDTINVFIKKSKFKIYNEYNKLITRYKKEYLTIDKLNIQGIEDDDGELFIEKIYDSRDYRLINLLHDIEPNIILTDEKIEEQNDKIEKWKFILKDVNLF